MGSSRKEWIAKHRIGDRIGWYGSVPEAGASLIRPFRPEDSSFDTIVATDIPDEGLASLVDQLREDGRLLVALRFGDYYPSQIVKALRSKVVPTELEVIAKEVRLVANRQRPNIGSWQLVASPRRLLELTEQGTTQTRENHFQQIETLRSAYRRLAERLMNRATEKAGASVATASRVSALEERISDLNTKVKSLDTSADARLGRALIQAARNPRDAIRLPRRLLGLYVDQRRQLAAPTPSGISLERNLSSLLRRTDRGLALIVDGRTSEEARGIDGSLAAEGWGVLMATADEPTGLRSAQTVMHSRISELNKVFPDILQSEASPRVALFRSPHPFTAKWLNQLNAWGWITIYDILEDWPSKLKDGAPHRYRRSVEAFLAHNADVLVAYEETQHRIPSLTDRPFQVMPSKNAAQSARIILELADAEHSIRKPEKGLHAKELG